MFNSKSKRLGFFGTILFHVLFIIVCFYTTMGSTLILPPEGIEVQYMPYEKINKAEETILVSKDKVVDEVVVDHDELVEKLIQEKTEETVLPTYEDSLTNQDQNPEKEDYISLELEEALNKLNQPKSSQELFNDNMEDTIVVDDLELNDKNDGYVLSDNRFAVMKVKPRYTCNESGTVVVRVWVNREGRTIKAEAGVRGTTESASCLLSEAKIAALKTTWTPYFDAPEIQIGQITYNFYRN
jgi:hypothetical protein